MLIMRMKQNEEFTLSGGDVESAELPPRLLAQRWNNPIMSQ